ncbi:hypothetical protein GUITHDRAFT_122267 [Guillardia theta CCMP2712]|uniref:Hint domain-containing protein n=1 Tax=Guillardia theta (strain CCMP2712) TaxID=905079 RepID=L1I5M5_GUITC|nr:hypothetical protein GUITHDRAFT_122267 [Guillardia theta CCMP2712]EKX31541.1 hypothetical protein GUITHDRAFT_122267 [Guillardia theta CCMP2712]|eukprot:XP_005818521.1 hypothetical protein GUITHDRAFT_122267 [Guillardia theta CCMP2712]
MAAVLVACAIYQFPSSQTELADIDGPSPRDPPRSSWAREGKGTSAWMEQHKRKVVVKHQRGRQDRPFDSILRNVPRQVSVALDIPMLRVQQLEKQAAKKVAKASKAQLLHSLHRIMLAEANITDMSVCKGKWQGCEPLAKNILAVASEISSTCSSLYFNEQEYYKCERNIAEPLCLDVDREFPSMCREGGKGHDYVVPHGYVGSEDPANIEGNFCQGCEKMRTSGCFDAMSTVTVRGKGDMRLLDLKLGDEVASADDYGLFVWSPVIFIHDHKEDTKMRRVKFGGEGEKGEVSLTDTHPLLLAADKDESFSQARRVRARDIKQGDRILVMKGGKAAPVTASLLPLLLFLFLLVIFFLQVVGSSLFSSQVRYVLTANDRILVDGVVGPTASTMLGAAETLPFKALHVLGLLELPAVARVLSLILESPALSWSESLLDRLAPKAAAAAARVPSLLSSPSSY